MVLVGGSGFLGRGLRQRLTSQGHEVIVIGRGSPSSHERWSSVQWDGQSLGDWAKSLEGSDVVVHLAGRRVDCRPTRANIDELISSREGTVRLVGRALSSVDDPPAAWVQLSSLAIFGDSGDELIDEHTTPPASGPRQQVEVCQRWEAAYREVTGDVARTVLLRPAIGIGGKGDPATERLAMLARFGLAGRVGPGTQWVSWIGAEDFFDLLVRAVTDPSMEGLFHVTSPNPVSNAELMAAYRSAVGRTFGLPTPKPVVKLGAWVFGSDPGLALTGRRAVPTRLVEHGYEFKVTAIDQAVREAVVV